MRTEDFYIKLSQFKGDQKKTEALTALFFAMDLNPQDLNTLIYTLIGMQEAKMGSL